MHALTRRQVLGAGAGAAVVAGVGIPVSALADADETQKMIKEFAGGAAIKEGRVELDMPEIAENGNTVELGISVDSPMSESDYVKDVIVLADGNPNPGVATFHFTPLSGEASAVTRMRLAKTQNVYAVAKMSDGSVYMTKTTVKVTIGGCGG